MHWKTDKSPRLLRRRFIATTTIVGVVTLLTACASSSGNTAARGRADLGRKAGASCRVARLARPMNALGRISMPKSSWARPPFAETASALLS